MGKSPYRAAMEAADEIGLAVIAITLTIVAIFAPVSFMGGIAGQYFQPVRPDGRGRGVVLAAGRAADHADDGGLSDAAVTHDDRRTARHARLCRLLAITVARIRCCRASTGRRWRAALQHAYLTLVVGFGFLSARSRRTALLPTGFIPDEDTSRVVVSVELPPGSTLEDTRVTTDKIVDALSDDSRRSTSVFVLGGASPTGEREVRARRAVTILLKPKAERERTPEGPQGRHRRQARQRARRARLVRQRARRARDVLLDPVQRRRRARRGRGAASRRACARSTGYLNVAAAGSLSPAGAAGHAASSSEAARLGVTPEAIAEAVRVATIGDVGANLAKFYAGDRLMPIRVQLDEAARTDIRSIAALRVTNSERRLGPARPRSPTSASARGRARSTAMTASAAPRSAPTCQRGFDARHGAGALQAASSRRSSCRPACASPRPATPRSRARSCSGFVKAMLTGPDAGARRC